MLVGLTPAFQPRRRASGASFGTKGMPRLRRLQALVRPLRSWLLRRDCLPNRNPVPVGRLDAELARAPWLVCGDVKRVDALCLQLREERIHVVDQQIRKIVVATQLARMHIVWALAQHDHAIVSGDEDPARIFVHDAKAEDLGVEFRRFAHLVHGKNVVVLEYLHKTSERLNTVRLTQKGIRRPDDWH
jgi:hypothetical protein